MSFRSWIESERQTMRQLSNGSRAVGPVVEDLSKRDSRFLFIKESFDEFLHGEFGLRETETLLEAATSNLLGPSEMRSLTQEYQSAEDDGGYCFYLIMMFYDIVNVAIYELLNLFDIDITLEQARELATGPGQNISLLKALYEKSKDLVPQPAKAIPLNDSASSSEEQHDYRYLSLLESSNIRVLCIQPGPEDSPIECRLEEHSLDSDMIYEALSYVWGEPICDEVIKVNGSSFSITKHLKDILRGLRHREVTRTIWIDAICIDQSDLEEKVHQVRLMSDIYSRAQKVTIWLGNWPTGQMIPKSNLMDYHRSILAPAPERFGGNLMDQYDLVGILEALREYQTDSAWDEKRLALSIMLVRCVNIIMMHKWWERIWTIQEAALSPNEPIIHFRGYSFPLGTFFSALDTAVSFLYDEPFRSAPVDASMRSALLWQVVHAHSCPHNPFLRLLRPEGEREGSISNPRKRLFQFVIISVSNYRATDPRDKIFALQSLLVKSAGRLINVDYNESAESVYRRISAQCLSRLPHSILCYKLITERPDGAGNNYSGPSWVHDFTYSNVDTQNVFMGERTLHGFILSEERHHPMYEGQHETTICFATPKTLFCSGISTGIIYHTQPVPDLSEARPSRLFQLLRGFLRQYSSELDAADRPLESTMQDLTTDNITTRDRAGRQSTNLRGVRSVRVVNGRRKILLKFMRWLDGKVDDGNSPSLLDYHDLAASLPDFHKIMELLTLGSPAWKTVLEKRTRCANELLTLLLPAIAGTYLFATRDGIIGLATASVQKGDILAIIHRYPAYVILRETKQNQGSALHDTKKHRIVARAAIAETQEEMKARIDEGLQEQLFQII